MTQPALHPAAPTGGAPLASPTSRADGVATASSASLIGAPLDVFVAGVGRVGSELLDQIARLDATPSGSGLRVVGGATTRGASYFPDGAPAPTASSRDACTTDCAPTDWAALAPTLAAHPRPLAIVDATGSAAVDAHYESWLAAGVSVVTPSKLSGSGDGARFGRLRALADDRRAHYRYETAVGAALPLIGPLLDLVGTGDRIRSIRATLSGTLGFIYTEVERGVPFSHAVADAVTRGYAEPDPRLDLSGEDVARKAIILARTAGLTVERADVDLERTLPASVFDAATDRLDAALAAQDEAWVRRTAAATAQGERWRYLARITADGGRARIQVGPEAVAAGSAFGRLDGTDNLVEITTERYAASPLRVQGPGAGPAVTAAGVLADLRAVARATVARPS